MIETRRLLMIALLTIAPVLAACGTPTGNDDPPPPNPPTDSTAFDQRPWN